MFRHKICSRDKIFRKTRYVPGKNKIYHTTLEFAPTLLTLIRHSRHPRYPPQHTNQFTHAGATPNPPTLLHHPRSRTPTLARYPCKHASLDTQAGTNSTPFLKLFFWLIQEKNFLNLHLLLLYHKVLFWSHPCF